MVAASTPVATIRRHRPRSLARRGRLRRRVGLLLATLLLAWGAGFGWFVDRILAPTPPVGRAQGIVVLTGGAGRMRKAFLLLLAGRAPYLLISGVAADTSLAEIAGLARVPRAELRGRVDLDRHSGSTAANARAAAAWARARGLHSLIVVTSFYHMPRAMREFRAALPGVRLRPASVAPDAPLYAWPPGLWRIVVTEYCKWLVASAGLGGPAAWLEGRSG